jgi:teichuronic acid biosynthesis glycosyltransferase TuaC
LNTFATSNRKLRIALVTPLLPVPHDPASGRYIYEIARALSELADVKVYLQKLRYPRLPGMRPRSYLYGQVDENYAIEGLDVQALSFPAVPGLTRAINGCTAGRVLLPRVRPFKPDVMLAYWVYPDGDAAVRVARALGVPCAIGALGSDIHVRSGISTRLTRATIARCDALLTVSDAMRRHAIDRFGARPDRVHTIINGYNTSVFKPLARSDVRPALGVASDAKLIVYVGRLVEAKGLNELVTAFDNIAAQDASARLVLLGDGQMKDALAARVAASKNGARIHMPGAVAHEEVARWIAASNLLTLPSWSEGYPNVLVEALACGRPVVATKVGGIPEIVTAANGILVPVKNAPLLEAALRDALARAWDEPAIAAAMQRTWRDVAAETLAVCEGLVGAAARAGKPAD